MGKNRHEVVLWWHGPLQIMRTLMDWTLQKRLMKTWRQKKGSADLLALIQIPAGSDPDPCPYAMTGDWTLQPEETWTPWSGSWYLCEGQGGEQQHSWLLVESPEPAEVKVHVVVGSEGDPDLSRKTCTVASNMASWSQARFQECLNNAMHAASDWEFICILLRKAKSMVTYSFQKLVPQKTFEYQSPFTLSSDQRRHQIWIFSNQWSTNLVAMVIKTLLPFSCITFSSFSIVWSTAYCMHEKIKNS